VAQCGLTGTLLGPPNYHDYQNKLRKLHTERFSRMPFEAYKAKVKFVKDEAVVKKWLEEQSFKAEYIGLNLPEPARFASREDAEKHFREVHLPNLVKSVDAFTVGSVEGQRFMSRGLRTLLRHTIEDQRRFPLKVATVLSQQLAGHGLHFFKVNKTVTHVCVARPHYLDLKTTLVSDGVRKIVEFIDAHPNCTRRRLFDTLAPSRPVAATLAPAVPTEAAAPTGEAEGGAAVKPAVPAVPAMPAPTPEQTAVVTDLHWLIHQGHVIEFTDGRMETAKAPKPKPPTPPKAPATPRSPAPAATAPAPATPAGEAPVASEVPAVAEVQHPGPETVEASAPAASEAGFVLPAEAAAPPAEATAMPPAAGEVPGPSAAEPATEAAVAPPTPPGEPEPQPEASVPPAGEETRPPG